jgi:hypothetical protein
MRRLNSATTLSFGVARWPSAMAPSGAWWPRRATRPAPLASARPCRRPRPCGSARSWCSYRRALTSTAPSLGIANGEDNRPVVADRPRKSSGSETTFERDLTTPTEIVAGIEAMADEVWAWCEKANAFGRTVTVKVKFADFRLVTRSRSFSSVVARHDLLRQASLELAHTLLPTAMAVRLLGVTLSNFDQTPTDAVNALPLFEVGKPPDPGLGPPRTSQQQVGPDGAACAAAQTCLCTTLAARRHRWSHFCAIVPE